MLPAVFDFLNGPVRDLVTQIYDAVGYLGVALWVAIESVIIPIPSELVLPFAGFLVGTGDAVEPLTGQPWSYWLVVLAGTHRCHGRGARRVRDRRVGRPAHHRALGPLSSASPAADLDRAEAFFARYGDAASFFGRMVPVIRSLVSFAAGVARMPLGRFIVFSFLGSLPFTALLVFAGVQLGANWESIGARPQALRVRDPRVLVLACRWPGSGCASSSRAGPPARAPNRPPPPSVARRGSHGRSAGRTGSSGCRPGRTGSRQSPRWRPGRVEIDGEIDAPTVRAMPVTPAAADRSSGSTTAIT